MPNHSRLKQIIASAKLPSPKGVALLVIQLTQGDEVSSQQVAHALKR